jgi:hypothetical protein
LTCFEHALHRYWELIPKKTLTALLGKLVGNLAADATSVAVRVAVFKGLTFLLDNHLCRPLLKELLPKMAEMVHDPSERVRKAFYKLLLVVSIVLTFFVALYFHRDTIVLLRIVACPLCNATMDPHASSC